MRHVKSLKTVSSGDTASLVKRPMTVTGSWWNFPSAVFTLAKMCSAVLPIYQHFKSVMLWVGVMRTSLVCMPL
jgi:hypothetical protein